MKAYRKFMKAVTKVEEVVLSVAMMLVLVLTFGNVIARKIFMHSWGFTEEITVAVFVLISLLGLLAMSTYFADENTKQIAVRKVFGSDVTHETWRNVRSYMVLTGIACAIGIPLAVWAARVYLERFAYRVENYGWVFVVAVIISLAIAFGTVLWQTLKAAKTNPAIELKKE